MTLRYLELFAGAGGMSCGFEQAGWTPVAHAEIDHHARAVLRYHWPQVPLHGDVQTVGWSQYAGRVDVVSGGSPCQDLSVAGKGQGLAGARSGLFYELVRAWEATGARYLVWENVEGALGSNAGADFAAVISALVGGPCDVPADGWARAGVAAGEHAVAARRVLDLRWWGLPQSRRRVFAVVARTGGADPAEVLDLAARSQWCSAAGRLTFASAGTVESSPDTHSGYWCRLHEAELGFCGCRVEMRHCDRCDEWTSGLHYEWDEGCAHCGRAWGESWVPDTIGALTDGAHNGGGTNGQDFYTGRVIVQEGFARRLVPVELERVMGWFEEWTERGVRETGEEYEVPDGARMKMAANGVAAPMARWIAARLGAADAALVRRVA